MTITEFLEARIAEDAADALAANAWASHGGPTQWIGQPGDRLVVRLGAGGPHIARHSPMRVLAECGAKRAIIEYHALLLEQSEEMELFGYHATGLRIAIKHLAAVYKDHPDYDEGWAL